MQLNLYQLSRLLYDLNPNLFYLLKENDVTPFFYAAPWFLTLFASQFPIAFCARVLGRESMELNKLLLNQIFFLLLFSWQISSFMKDPPQCSRLDEDEIYYTRWWSHFNKICYVVVRRV